MLNFEIRVQENAHQLMLCLSVSSFPFRPALLKSHAANDYISDCSSSMKVKAFTLLSALPFLVTSDKVVMQPQYSTVIVWLPHSMIAFLEHINILGNLCLLRSCMARFLEPAECAYAIPASSLEPAARQHFSEVQLPLRACSWTSNRQHCVTLCTTV